MFFFFPTKFHKKLYILKAKKYKQHIQKSVEIIDNSRNNCKIAHRSEKNDSTLVNRKYLKNNNFLHIQLTCSVYI